MTTTCHWLADLVRRAPFLATDTAAAEKAGDTDRLAYAAAVAAWRAEAELALAEAERSGTGSAPHHDAPDAYARAANVAALLRLDAAE